MIFKSQKCQVEEKNKKKNSKYIPKTSYEVNLPLNHIEALIKCNKQHPNLMNYLMTKYKKIRLNISTGFHPEVPTRNLYHSSFNM